MQNQSNLTVKQQHLKNLEEQTLELMNYDADKPKDLFQFYHPQLRRKFVDGYNLMRCWLQNLLFCKNLYPSQAFETRTAYGKQVNIVCSKKLRKYLDDFFSSLSQNIQNLLSKNNDFTTKPVEVHRCHVSIPLQYGSQSEFKDKDRDQIKQTTLNTVQKEMCFKRFLDKSQESFKEGIMGNKDITFKLYMGYNWQQQYKINSHKMHLLQNWTQKDKLPIVGELTSSADTFNFSIFSERISFQQMN